MTTRNELLLRLKQATVKGSLKTVFDDAIDRITNSTTCEVEATDVRQSATHYAFIYQRRADNPNPTVSAIPGLLPSLENFKGENGNLEMIVCSSDSGSVAIWFSETGNVVGCILLGFAPM